MAVTWDKGECMGRFDTILWDVDQTLLDFKRSQVYALYHSFEHFGRQADEGILALYDRINDSWWKRYELGEVTKEELSVGRFRTLFRELGIKDIEAQAFGQSYQETLGSVFFFKDDSYGLCSKLKGRIKQYAVTNGFAAPQRNKLRLSGLDKVLDGIFVSEEIGWPKPSLQYFEMCFKQIPDFRKDKALIVGDSLSSDIKGGNNAGIACCWYDPEGAADARARASESMAGLKIDYVIRNLWEVEDIL